MLDQDNNFYLIILSPSITLSLDNVWISQGAVNHLCVRVKGPSQHKYFPLDVFLIGIIPFIYFYIYMSINLFFSS